MRNPNIDRVRDLDEIPSPFLEGAFDSIMAANPSESWIGLWETNRGCPFRCTFCDWGSATAAKVTKFGEERLYREVDWFADKKIEYIFCCDANFGILKRDVDIAELRRRHQAAHRLSGGAVGAEHQERHRARLRDAEDPVRCRPEQGRGACPCRAST